MYIYLREMHYYADKSKTCLCLIFITIVVLCQLVKCVSPQKKVCPIYCRCNLKNKLNHADCSDKRLISPNTAVPYAVQDLDLSHNDITILDNECFRGYIHLINLSLAHNAINTIYLDTFGPLKRIRFIDLSHNRLESVDARLFETNSKLHTLNLAGNKFMSLQSEALLQSRYLRVLNLAHAQINELLPEHYSKLAQLEELDLSYNLILTIDKFAAQAPKHLLRLNLDGNNLNCDESLENAIEKLEARKVQITYSGECQRKQEAENGITLNAEADGMPSKFARMELLEDAVEDTAIESGAVMKTKKEAKEANEADAGDSHEQLDEATRLGVLSDWHYPVAHAGDEYEDYFDVDEHDQDQLVGNEDNLLAQKEKSLNETCQKWCVAKSPTKPVSNNFLNFGAGKNYSDLDLLFVFICGIAIGIALTIFIGSCIACIWRCATIKATTAMPPFDGEPNDRRYALVRQAQPPASAMRSAVDAVRSPAIATHDESETVYECASVVAPQPPRRRQRHRQQRRSAVPIEARALVRQDQLMRAVADAGGAGDNFISRLFGRPARHQYYRAINANTATLIRRLSRSNLFNNRHFGDRDRGGDRDRDGNRFDGRGADRDENRFDDRVADRDGDRFDDRVGDRDENRFDDRVSERDGDRFDDRIAAHDGESITRDYESNALDVGESNGAAYGAASIENNLAEVTIASRAPQRQRPETPPPLYSEIVGKDCN